MIAISEDDVVMTKVLACVFTRLLSRAVAERMEGEEVTEGENFWNNLIN